MRPNWSRRIPHRGVGRRLSLAPFGGAVAWTRSTPRPRQARTRRTATVTGRPFENRRPVPRRVLGPPAVRRRVATCLLSALLVLGACGGSSDSVAEGAPAAASANQADVDFAVAMSMHRGQALTLAEIAKDRATDPTVVRILARIRTTEGTAVDEIARWLGGWVGPGIDVEHDHGYGPTKPGMLSEGQMNRVARTAASTFDDVLLTALIAHHRAAIPVLDRQLADGRSIEARAMAEGLAALYQAELKAMQAAVGRRR
ncbi:MAG: DUF305 domain-containing protein [Sporichthyaceae bacterium]